LPTRSKTQTSGVTFHNKRRATLPPVSWRNENLSLNCRAWSAIWLKVSPALGLIAISVTPCNLNFSVSRLSVGRYSFEIGHSTDIDTNTVATHPRALANDNSPPPLALNLSRGY
jgi:hypothetical protein